MNDRPIIPLIDLIKTGRIPHLETGLSAEIVNKYYPSEFYPYQSEDIITHGNFEFYFDSGPDGVYFRFATLPMSGRQGYPIYGDDCLRIESGDIRQRMRADKFLTILMDNHILFGYEQRLLDSSEIIISVENDIEVNLWRDKSVWRVVHLTFYALHHKFRLPVSRLILDGDLPES